MKITALELVNVKSFKKLDKTEFSDSINIFTGLNNSGKSIILKSIFSLQEYSLSQSDITKGQVNGYINIFYSNIAGVDEGQFRFSLNENRLFDINSGGSNIGEREKFKPIEPANIIYPYFSKRKVAQYNSEVDEVSSKSVAGNHANLAAKIDRLNNPNHDFFEAYKQACLNILGFEICAIHKDGGKQAAYYIKGIDEHILVSSMGEGVPNILGFVVDLCVAENKIFLIEELENDLHPKALKSLLNLIISKSATNQFFISTHSNIVLKHLGGVVGSKVFKVSNNETDPELKKMYLSHIDLVESSEDRRLLLESLGYDPLDFDNWSGWLFLEESSAEKIIREYLIKWFVPELQNKLRTFSSGGISNVEPRFEDFNNLFVFVHLAESYKNRVWVAIDNGEVERNIIKRMQAKYQNSGWNEKQFINFKEHDFEKYYPKKFNDEVDRVLSLSDHKRAEKMKLLSEVEQWISENEEVARKEFEISAKEIIDFLSIIAEKIHT